MRNTVWGSIVGACAAIALAACNPSAPEPEAQAEVTSAQAVFGTTPDGQEVEIFTLTNANGVEVRIMEYGAAIVSLKTPDRDGTLGEITAGFDTFEPYLAGTPYFGAIVGRYGNRIAAGRFTLDGTQVQLPLNDGPNHLHGGPQGFDKRVWTGEILAATGGTPTVRFTYVSADGEMGYPGELTVHATYQLNNDNTLSIDYEATTTAPTVVNVTNHAYFNLSGFQSDVLGHQLTINADRYTPVNRTLIPTGELAAVEGTPFDFRQPHLIGERIEADHEQIRFGGGYDHNWVLNQATPDTEVEAAVLSDPASGRVMTVRTTEPGIQFYSGNFLDGSLTGRSNYPRRSALCLETQHFPDSPNHENFPSTRLNPGETYTSRTVFAFSTAAAG